MKVLFENWRKTINESNHEWSDPVEILEALEIDPASATETQQFAANVCAKFGPKVDDYRIISKGGSAIEEQIADFITIVKKYLTELLDITEGYYLRNLPIWKFSATDLNSHELVRKNLGLLDDFVNSSEDVYGFYRNSNAYYVIAPKVSMSNFYDKIYEERILALKRKREMITRTYDI